MPIDRGGADILGPLEQHLAAIGTDDVAEQLAQETHVGVVRDRGKLSHAAMLHRGGRLV
jgi:hypothetical protein